MHSLCRDCGWTAEADARRCPACASPRVLRHPELHRLTVAHVDCDAFYASVEKRDRPELRDHPVIVGGGVRGVVTTACYMARVYGVRSAMPSVTALRRCPALVFVPPRFDVYRRISRQIRAIFADYTDLIETLSLDEADLDVTVDRHGLGSARAIAEAIRARIRDETALTASAGVSYNKFIAKLASDQNKPDGVCVTPPRAGPAFVASLPVKRFHGVGPVTARRMEMLGILTGADLRDRPLSFLQEHFPSRADYLYGAARGEDYRPVRPDRPTKSVGAERTFDRDLSDAGELREALARVADAAWTRIERHGARGRTVTLKLRYADFRTITRARSQTAPVTDRARLLELGEALLAGLLPIDGGVRLLAHDAFVRDALTERDVVVLSLGGNDVALRPSAATVAAMGLLTRVTPTWLLRLGCAPGLGHFFALFHDRIEEIVTKIAAANGGRKPAKVLVCMIYYLDETPGGSWADGVLSKLGYDSDLAKLKLIIQMLFERVASAGFRVDGVEVVPFALFKVLDGTDSRDYVQRVEPSVQGGRKMARAIVDELFPRPPSSSPHDGDDVAVVEPTQRT